MSKPVIMITGASSGIGAALAKVFSNAGYAVALLARNVDAMQKLQLPNSLCLKADVTDIKGMTDAVNSIETQLGPIDCLINNAGYAKGGDFLEIDHATHDQMVNVNIKGVLHAVEAVLPLMQNRKRGTVINISSIADRSSRPNLSTYAATKAAVRSLTESLRKANAKNNIRICNFAPAKIKTPMLVSAGLANDEMIDVTDTANAILWLYQQPQNICIRDIVYAPTTYED